MAETVSDVWQIDTRRVAERGERIARRLTSAELPRLRKECAARFDPVEVSVQGVVTPHGKPGVRVTMQASIKVPCQRCHDQSQAGVTSRNRFDEMEYLVRCVDHQRRIRLLGCAP